MSNTRKQAILDALDAFVRQRPGLEFGNYGDATSYRSEMRAITRDLHDYRQLRRAVEHDGITAEALLEASRSAFSGRLTLDTRSDDDSWRVDYTTGQYFPTEYRKAACAVLAAALWAYARERTMPAETTWRVRSWGQWTGNRFAHEESKPLQINAACAELERLGGSTYGHVQGYVNGKTPGDWLRAKFRDMFGRGIAGRYFL